MIKKVTTSNPNKLKEAREKLSVREREYMIQVGIPTKGCRLGKWSYLWAIFTFSKNKFKSIFLLIIFMDCSFIVSNPISSSNSLS